MFFHIKYNEYNPVAWCLLPGVSDLDFRKLFFTKLIFNCLPIDDNYWKKYTDHSRTTLKIIDFSKLKAYIIRSYLFAVLQIANRHNGICSRACLYPIWNSDKIFIKLPKSTNIFAVIRRPTICITRIF